MRQKLLIGTLVLALCAAPTVWALEGHADTDRWSPWSWLKGVAAHIGDVLASVYAPDDARGKASVMIDPSGVTTPQVGDPDESGVMIDPVD